MPKITVTFDIEEELIRDVSGNESLEEAIIRELRWMEQSGMRVENWRFMDGEVKKLLSEE